MINKLRIKTINNKKLRIDLFVKIYILVLPFLFYLYTIAPENSSEWRLKWFTINSGSFKEVDYYIWLLFVKFLTLNILSIWFTTSKYVWKYVILIPVFFEIYKIFSILDFAERGQWIDISFCNTIITFVLYSITLIILSIKINYFNINRAINRKLNEEINMQLESVSKLNSKDCNLIIQNFLKLKNQKNRMDRKEYLAELIVLRDQITI